MGREVKRVPLDFSFPIDASFHDAAYTIGLRAHAKVCRKRDHDECDFDYESEPPPGEGWQLWQTVSDGPVTPVFKTANELIDYMSQPVPVHERRRYDPSAYPEFPAGKGWRREIAEAFVRGKGWAPSMIATGGNAPEFGAAVVARESSRRKP